MVGLRVSDTVEAACMHELSFCGYLPLELKDTRSLMICQGRAQGSNLWALSQPSGSPNTMTRRG